MPQATVPLSRPHPGRESHARKRGAGQADPGRGGTLDEVVDLVVPFLPHGLITTTSAARLREIAGEVPAELVARVGLEFPLHSGVGDAHVLFSADSETGGMQMLAGRHPLVNLPSSLATSERWAPIVRFCRWREPGFPLHRATRDVWVDLADPDAPSFSFGMRLSGLSEATWRPVEVLLRALEVGFDALRGEPLEPPALGSLRAFVRRLPETARVDRAALVGGLPDHARLWLSRMSAQQIAELVEATRDHAEARRVTELLDELAPSAHSIRARVDVHEGVGRATELICTVDPDGSPPQVAARWRPLLNRLIAAGLCSDQRRDALLACYGLLREGQNEPWPQHLTKLSELFGDGTESILQWRLRHVAVQCDRGEPVGATAHVAIAHGWSRR
jgi:hypothetical protein